MEDGEGTGGAGAKWERRNEDEEKSYVVGGGCVYGNDLIRGVRRTDGRPRNSAGGCDPSGQIR